MKQIAYLVAPYHPAGGELINLGAARKIECVVRLLARLGFSVRLINSGHDCAQWGSVRLRRRIVGGQALVELRPFTLPSRPVGKLANAAYAHFLARALSVRAGQTLVWVYNGYAFESLFALAFRQPGRLVLELEDLPTARPRGFRWWQHQLERRLIEALLARADLVTCVNQTIAERVADVARCTLVLPGVIVESWRALERAPPFAATGMRIGYFGGLTVEKGAACLLALCQEMPERWRLVVTGSGELASEFRRAVQTGKRLEFHECVSEKKLCELMWSCDVLVNPHQSIRAMDDGVFPFKIYEYLSTARLVVTTELPETGLKLENAMVMFDGSSEALRDCLARARSLYDERADRIRQVAGQIEREFSEVAVARRVRAVLDLV